MKAFVGLLKKDFHIAKFGYITWLILLFMIMFGSFIVANKINEPMTVIGFLIMLMVLHLGFLPISVLNSLHVEGKTQMWLYNPQSSAMLLASKIVIAALCQIISQIILIIYSLVLFDKYIANTIEIGKITLSELMLVHFVILSLACYFTCWFLFYWTVYHSLGRFPAVRKIRWLIIAVMFFSINTIETSVLKIKPFKDFIYNWNIPVPVDQKFSYVDNEWSFHLSTVDIPIIPILLYFIIAFVLFWVSKWLLDRKIEV